VIHELKNPLGAMRSTLAVLRRRLGTDDTSVELTRIVDDEIDRLNDRVLNVLGFVRPGRPERSEVAVDDLLRQLLAVVESELARLEVQVRLEVEARATVVAGDPERLRQVFLNLLLNAREAMPTGGEVVITLRSPDRDEPPRQLEVTVADTGSGLPPGDPARLFEPFYTTKTLGTGLGLANVKRIVEDHGGTVSASRSDRGAVIRLCLPCLVPGG
jgi:signal transduction histidine kinase